MDSDNVGWQNLPKDLLEMIAERTHIRLLGAVCSSWRSSLFLPTNKSPLFSVKIPLPLFLQEAYDLNNDGYFNLTERIIYFIQSPSDQNNLNDGIKSRKEWILKLEETLLGKMKLFHPLSNDELLNRENKLPRVMNLFDYNVFEVGKEYKLTWVHPQNDRHKSKRLKTKYELTWAHLLNDLLDKPNGLESHVQKVVMSSSGNAIMCIFGGRKLGYFKYGDENWYMIDDGLNGLFDYSDIIHHKEKFYVIDEVGNIIVIDSSHNFEVIDYHNLEGKFYPLTFVESNGDLFVVASRFTWYKFSPSCYGGDYFGGGENLGCHICKFSSRKANLCNQTFFVEYKSCSSVPKIQLSCCTSVPTIQLSQSCYPSDYHCSGVSLFRHWKRMLCHY